MKQFIGDIFEDYSILWEEESHHAIKVMRLKIGDEVGVTDGKGKKIIGKIQNLGRKIEIENTYIFEKEIKKTNVHIAISPTKNIDRFEFFIEKAVELGVTEISPIMCQNSERKTVNQDKIQKQIWAACKQSLRSVFPKLNPLQTVTECITNNNSQKFYVAHCEENYPKIDIKEIKTSENALFFIGPEGDFSLKEIDIFITKNAEFISLGINRLRTETAGIYVASCFY